MSQLADLVGLVRQLCDDNSWLPLPTAFPLSLAPACFACFDGGGSIAVTVGLGVPFNDHLAPHGYAPPPIMICCSDGICCKNLSSCKTCIYAFKHDTHNLQAQPKGFRPWTSGDQTRLEGFVRPAQGNP